MTYNGAVETHSLYIHWPFCVYKCHFCPFISFSSHERFMERYNQALCKEIELFEALCAKKQTIGTIFIGGGTPSTCSDDLMLDTFGKLESIFAIDRCAEVTIEVNPGTVRAEQIDLWRKLGINRLSIGVQSLNDSVLKKLNRLQSSQQVFALLDRAERVFENISIDLILGLPGVSVEDWKCLIKQVVHWPIQHISIYFLMVHKHTPLYQLVKDKAVNLPLEDGLVDLYNWTVDVLANYGFERYEISNFARQGYVCRHNVVYWDREPYKGFGLGACSFDGASRFQNEKNLVAYMEGIEKCESIETFSERLTKKEAWLERLMLGLRKSQGVSIIEVCKELSDEEKKRFISRVAYLKKNNFIKEENDRLILTPSAFTVQNEVIVYLSM